MALRDVIESVESREKTLRVYAAPADEGLVAALREYFDSQNLAVEHEPVSAGRPAHAVLTEGGEFLCALGDDPLRALVSAERPVRGLDDRPPYAPLLERLDGTTFASYDRRKMLTASREIEDRAWRMREGELHAGFQRLSRLTSQAAAYRRLAEIDLDVHVYGADDEAPPAGEYTVHATSDPDVTGTWFVAFDGGGDPLQKCALLARERSEGRFYGFWTYEPSLVDRVLSALAEARAVAAGD